MTQIGNIIAKWLVTSGHQTGASADADAHREAPALLSALDAAGFVVVPREPTEAMSVDGGLAIERSMFEDQDPLVFDGAAKCYRAMIEARPK